MPVNFLPQENLFLPVYKFIFSRKEIYFHTGENLFLPAKKFNLSRKGVYLGSQSQPFYTAISAMLNGEMAEITR